MGRLLSLRGRKGEKIGEQAMDLSDGQKKEWRQRKERGNKFVITN